MPFAQSRRALSRHAVFAAALVLLYLLLNRPEVILLSQLGFTAWYPAAGLILATMLGISPWYVLLVIFSDSLAGIWIYHQPLLSFGETIGAAGVSTCYALAAYVLRSRLRIDVGLRHRRDVFRYVIVTLSAAILSTAVGTLSLLADHSIRWNELWASARGWFFGDAIGVLGIAPFLLIHVLPWVRKKLSPSKADEHAVSRASRKMTGGEAAIAWLEAAGQALALVGLLWFMFGHPDRPLYLSFLPILWIAMRQGIRRAVTGVLALNFGIVVAMHIYPPAPVVLDRVGLLMLVVSAVGLITGSAVTERHRMGLDLQEQTHYLHSLIEHSPLGIAVLDREHRVELTNAAFESLFLYDRKEIAGCDFNLLLAASQESGSIPFTALVEAGHTLHEDVRWKRKDGRILNLEMHAVPLMANGRVRGAYTIYKDISEQVEAAAAEREHAESLNQLVKELEQRSNQLTVLNEMGSLLDCSVTTAEACAVVARFAPKLFPEGISGTLYLFKSSRNLVEAAAKWGADSSSEAILAPDSCWALRRGQPHWSDGRESGITCPHWDTNSIGECLCVPMVGHGETLGVLHLEFSSLQFGDSETDSAARLATQRLAMTAGGQIALSLANLRLRDTLRDQSIRDPLTGLFNRRFMEESLERELQRASRKKHPVSILFIDLDHFKKFNDTFGHDAGDLVLRSVAELFRNFFRVDDVICRFGGEEFAIILPESSSENSAMRANSLREAIKRIKLDWNGQALGSISASMGIATFPEHGTAPEELLKVADQCLYQSKKAGRDAVTVAHQPAAK